MKPNKSKPTLTFRGHPSKIISHIGIEPKAVKASQRDATEQFP